MTKTAPIRASRFLRIANLSLALAVLHLAACNDDNVGDEARDIMMRGDDVMRGDDLMGGEGEPEVADASTLDSSIIPEPEAFDGVVESVGMGRAVGGFPVPIWLYRGGWAIHGTDAPLPSREEAFAHFRRNPDLWTEWRRTGFGVELKGNGNQNWNLLYYDYEVGPIMIGSRITGVYGAENNVYITAKYKFGYDGTFQYCEYIPLARSGKRSSGAYEIVDGYVIRMGTSRVSFVHDPFNRPNTLWIDGSPYKRLSEYGDLSCL